MGVISDITSTIGLASKAMELADSMKNLELKAIIVELKGKLIDLKEEIVGLREENARLTEEMKRTSAPPEVTLKDGHYYEGDDGPFCTACYDSGRKMIRLTDCTRNEQMVMGFRRKCPVCRTMYST